MSDHDLDPHSQHQALRRRSQQAETEPYQRQERAPSVTLVVGRHRWVVPTASIVGAILAGMSAAWGVVQSERSAIRQADADLSARIDAQADQVRACKAQLATTEVVLTEIRTQLARIDARVAEVQVTLMRGRP